MKNASTIDWWSWRGFFYTFVSGIFWWLHWRPARFLVTLAYPLVLGFVEYALAPELADGGAERDVAAWFPYALVAWPVVMGFVQSEAVYGQYIEHRSRLAGTVTILLFAIAFLLSKPGYELRHQLAAEIPVASIAAVVRPPVDWRELRKEFDMEKKRFGFVDQHGVWVLPPKYLHIMGTLTDSRFRNNRALAVLPKDDRGGSDNRITYIDSTGKAITPYFKELYGRLPGGNLACVGVAPEEGKGLDQEGVINIETGEWVHGPGQPTFMYESNFRGRLCRYFEKAKVMVIELSAEEASKGIPRHRAVFYGRGDRKLFEKSIELLSIRGDNFVVDDKILRTFTTCVDGSVGPERVENREYLLAMYDGDGRKVSEIRSTRFKASKYKCP
ncbi:hypothetical protein [Kordiimonas lacus]|uniref:Uncharacterized protein n=1 Tax=Kordiimonas lacus TaxID=637679 RepID=A0A1G6UG06_9PROT|nr:hypothetical protein [Kordiimonas lacus]SDD40191.1 hypothetical protein SAMN04488071_0575 [Kordiimonas lacus]